MAVGNMIRHPRRFQTPAVAADHPGIGPGFVEKHQSLDVFRTDQDVPPGSFLANVRPPLFGRVQDFF